jgi:flagellar hook-associated protein 2
LATNAATAFETVDDVVGSGTMTIQYGTTTTEPYAFTADSSKAIETIEVSDANKNTTLSGLRDYINQGDYGFSATIVNDGNGYRLTLTSKDTGAANSMEVTVVDDDATSTDNSGLSQLAFNENAQASMIQTVQSQDATLSINGLEITRDSNTVTGAIDGLTLNLSQADPGNPVTVTVGAGTEDIKSAIVEFVDGFNGLLSNINSLTAYNADSAAGVLIGDYTVRNITTQIRNVLSTTVSQVSSSFQSLAELGITSDKQGLLEVDNRVLDEALSGNADDVASIFTEQGRASDSGITFLSSSSDTQSGFYSVNITQMATQGEITAGTVNSLTIDDSNDTFSVNVDGINSRNITLNQGAFADGAELAAHIQAQINNDATLKAVGSSVTVAYDTLNNNFKITSQKFGDDSSVNIISVDTNTASTLGLEVASGTQGVDVAGTINGQSAEGSGQTLTSISGTSRGMVLAITSGAAGSRGSISLTKGITETLDNLLTSFLADDGFISTREEGFNDELEKITELRQKLDDRVSSLEARLVQQFSAMDALISQLNATSSYLTQQLDNFVKPNSINSKN